jgi:hypothetical protein
MKHNIWSIIFVGLGILSIFIGITSSGNHTYTERASARFIFFGIILIALSLFGMVPNRKSDNIKEAEIFNFRETDTDDNCGKCDRFDKNSFDGLEVNCKFFHIKTDENHICDLLKPQLKEDIVNNFNMNNNKHIIDYKDLLKKMR